MPRHRDTRLFPHQAGWPPTWRGRVPRLIDAERRLLFAWLNAGGRHSDELWYDVRMDGIPDELVPPPPDELVGDPELARNWWQQTARRCDAIARRGQTYTLVELRALADAQSIGEILIYDQLARAEWPALIWTEPLLIAARIRPSAARTLEAHGIELQLLPQLQLEPSTPLATLTR